jgi:hypothetical protein
MSWMAEINRVATKCFKAGLSATETLVLVQEACGNEALSRSNFLGGNSPLRDGRELVHNERGGRQKSTRTQVNIAIVAADLLNKLPSNRIKNDSRIFEHTQDCSSSDS